MDKSKTSIFGVIELNVKNRKRKKINNKIDRPVAEFALIGLHSKENQLLT